jgi:hypothetical protein
MIFTEETSMKHQIKKQDTKTKGKSSGTSPRDFAFAVTRVKTKKRAVRMPLGCSCTG